MAQQILSSKLAFVCLALSSVLWLGCGDDDPDATGDSGTTQGDGSTSNPDGSANTPDGSTSNPDGNVNTPDGNVNTPDGNVNTPDGSVTTPDAAATDDGGTVGTMCQDVVCGGNTPQCCITFQGGECIGMNDQCDGIKASCDGREDCQGSEVCCGSLQSGAMCTDTCDAQQLCNDKSDCSGPDKCCTFGGLGICLRNCPPAP